MKRALTLFSSQFSQPYFLREGDGDGGPLYQISFSFP